MRLEWLKDAFLCKELYAPFKIKKDIDYRENLQGKYEIVMQQAKKANADAESIKIINDFSAKILKSVDLYYKADIAESNNVILELVRNIGNNPFAVSSVTNSEAFPGNKNEELQFFRGRFGNPHTAFTAKDMLHLPRSERSKTRNYRFSIPGNPSMYLANTSYGCWLEMGCPAEIEFNVAPILLDGSQKIFNLAISIRNVGYLDVLEADMAHCWLKLYLEAAYENIEFSTVPFSIGVGGKEYLDDDSLNIGELMSAMQECKTASRTACPSVGAWCEQFQKDGNIIAITITSNLSGSYNSACVARNMVLEEQPEKQIAVIDSLSTGPEMVLILRKICELIVGNMDFETVIKETKKHMKNTHVAFALSSFDNLVKNGRMNKITGFIANKLGLLGVGFASERGTIEVKGVSRGRRKAIEAILNDMKLRGTYIKEVVISHCQNIEFAEQVKTAILNVWNDSTVTIIPTRGLCSYYAEQGGLIIGF